MTIRMQRVKSPTGSTSVRMAGFLGRFAGFGVLLLGLAFTLVPFVWAILGSFKNNAEIQRVPPTFLPEAWALENYTRFFTDPNIPLLRFFLNSLSVAGGNVIFILFTSSLLGYIFAKYSFWGRQVIFTIILAQMMIPFVVIMIPNYMILVRIDLVDNLWGLIIPSMVSAFGIFMMRQFIQGIPIELIDAARIDGASEFGIYARIIVPQLGPALSTLGIMIFMGNWNDYMWPLIVISSVEKRTLPLLLTWFNTYKHINYAQTMAGSVLLTIPTLIVYVLFQKWIVRGVVLSGVK
jgi:multiple sugar transport system permease protein